MGVLALQRPAVVHPGDRLGGGVVDQQAVLEVLAGVGEVDAVLVQLAAHPGVVGGLGEPDQVAAEGGGDGPHRGVPADLHRGLPRVHGVLVPQLQLHEVDRGALADQDGHVRVVRRRAEMLQGDGRRGVVADRDDDVLVDDGVGALSGEGEDDRLGRLGLRRDVDPDGTVGVRRREDREPVHRGATAQGPGLRTADPGEGDPLGQAGLPAQPVAGGTGFQQAPQPLQRREPPDLLAPPGDGEVSDVPGRSGVQVGGDLRQAGDALGRGHGTGGRRGGQAWGGSGIDGQRGHFLGSYGWGGGVRDQPTAPSICISIRRLSSRAYSIGSSLAIGSTKPRTIIAIASSSAMPRDIR
ncbi:hypothetical protein SDC9_109198 [bioreactor metagenome]|uniref:Uncharacterized protein n=1 Tax=bioreactor metagenome TaxID=1076179 RepID=A0A645BAJ1_9ZZZZ